MKSIWDVMKSVQLRGPKSSSPVDALVGLLRARPGKGIFGPGDRYAYITRRRRNRPVGDPPHG